MYFITKVEVEGIFLLNIIFFKNNFLSMNVEKLFPNLRRKIESYFWKRSL